MWSSKAKHSDRSQQGERAVLTDGTEPNRCSASVLCELIEAIRSIKYKSGVGAARSGRSPVKALSETVAVQQSFASQVLR